MRVVRWLSLAGLLGTAAFAATQSPAVAEADDPMQALAVGDFDGDGIPDIAVGLPDFGAGKLTRAGEVRVFSGARKKLLWKLTGKGRDDGYSDEVVAIGDIDGDGATDLAIGAPYAEPMSRVDFVSGKTGKVLRSEEDPTPIGTGAVLCAVGDGSGKTPVDLLAYQIFQKNWVYMEAVKGRSLGFVKDPNGLTGSVAYVGDVDGDGRADFALSDHSEDSGEVRMAGRIRVLSGGKVRAGSDSAKEAELLLLRGQTEMEFLGLEVAPAGDWDGDGKGDLLTGTSGGADAKAPWSVRVLSGKDGSELWNSTGEKGDYAIGGIVLTGDVDGDGKADVAVGTPGRKGKAGAVSVVSGKDGAVLWTVAGGTGERFGERVLAIADADGDGFPDLCVAAPGKSAGCVRFLSGKTGKVITSFNPLH